MDNKDKVILARLFEWQYQLDKYTNFQLVNIAHILQESKSQLFKQLENATITDWSKQRTEQLLGEVQAAYGTIKAKVNNDMGAMVAEAGKASYDEHSKILSFDGKASAVVGVPITANQMRALVDTTPVGGRTLSQWVDRTFDRNMRDKIQKEVAAGIINGDGYRDIVKRLKASIPGTERELKTLGKTYVQSVNVQAMKDVYNANPEIVKSVLWRATVGLNTCVECASLDGVEYPVNGHPGCPLHPLCRCVLVPITVAAEKMGLTAKDLNEMARPYTIERDGKLKNGKTGKVIESGTFKGNFESWLKNASEKQQRAFFGPKRYEALKDGRIKFDQLVDKQTGRLKRLDELGLGMRKNSIASRAGRDFHKEMDAVAKAVAKDEALQAKKLAKLQANEDTLLAKLHETVAAMDKMSDDSSVPFDFNRYRVLEAEYADLVKKRRSNWAKLKTVSTAETRNIRKFLEIGQPAEKAINAMPTSGTKKLRGIIEDAVKTVNNQVAKMLDPELASKVKPCGVFAEDGVRAYHNMEGGYMVVGRKNKATVFHEFGHHLEDNLGLQKAANDFLKRRTQGEALVPIWEGSDEMCRPDKFIDRYTGKHYNFGATEVVSMGLQYMHEDPVGFFKKDRDHFEFILKILRGYLND